MVWKDFRSTIVRQADYGGGGGGGVGDSIKSHLKQTGHSKQLVALVLAHPEHAFAKNEIYPSVSYWHYRSGPALLLVFPGFLIPESTGKRFASAGEYPQPEFSPEAFVRTVEWMESRTTIEYTGRATVVLFVASDGKSQAVLDGAGAPIDCSFVVEFDIEGLIKDGLVKDARLVFEGLIKLAQKHPAEDALVLFSQSLQADTNESSLLKGALSFLKIIPSEAREAAAAIVKAKRYFRIRDVRPE